MSRPVPPRVAGPPAPAPLLVGQAPSSEARDLLGASGARLAALCGTDLECYAAVFARTNLVSEFPGAVPGGGHRFPAGEARTGWARLLPALPGRRVILLGSRVARVVGFSEPFWTWKEATFEGRPFKLVTVPHPSSLSRWWQSSTGVLRAAAWWRDLYLEATETL